MALPATLDMAVRGEEGTGMVAPVATAVEEEGTPRAILAMVRRR